MLQLTLQMVVLMLAWPIVGFSAESSDEYPDPEIVELSIGDREALLAAPKTAMNQPPSKELGEAIRIGTVENIKVEKFEEAVRDESAEHAGRDTDASYQGWIRYTPVSQSDTRLYRPVVLCIWADREANRFFCQDESWIRLETNRTKKPIFFNGELSDEDVATIYDVIDNAGLVSTTDDQPVTSDKIYHIIKYPHAGNRVNVYVTTTKEGYTDVIFLAQTTYGERRSTFEITEWRCAQE